MSETGEGAEPTYGGQEPSAARGRRIAAGLAVVAVVAGGLFAVLSLGSDSNSPEDPVREMFEAVERGDALGVLEQLDPGEREALQDPLIDMIGELDRLEVLQDPDLRNVSGLEIQIDDLELSSQNVRDDVARVSIKNGFGRYRVEVAKLPLGRFVRDLLGDSNDDITEGSDTIKGQGDDFIASVKRDGRWYVSIGYSFAEQARYMPFERMGNGVPARGADSPEDAVRELIEAGAGLDLRRVIELLPPDELAALHEYAGLFIDEVESEAAETRSEIQVSIPTLELDAATDGDRSTVTIEKIDLEVKTEFNTFSVRDGCMHIEGQEDFAPSDICPRDRPMDALLVVPFGFLWYGGTDVEPPALSFAGKQPDIGIVTTQVDGKWYVSPTRTLLEGLVAVMRLAEPRDLDAIRDWFDRRSAAFYEDIEARYSCAEPPDGSGERMQQDCGYAEGELEPFPEGAYEEYHEPTEPTTTSMYDQ